MKGFLGDIQMNNSNWRERYRVRIAFVLGLIFLWRAQPRNLFFLILGLAIAFLGILFRQWSAGCVKKMDELATSGPYAIVRHPLYAGSFLAALGFILSASSFPFSMSGLIDLSKPYWDRTLLFWGVLWILIDSIYLPKIEKEERDLRAKFTESYAEYSKKVPQIFPRTLKFSNFDFSTFQKELWLKNKEYLSFVGYAAICTILVMRYIYHR